MAAAIVRAADALWGASGGYDPMVAAAMTHCIRSLAPAGRKQCNKRASDARSKSRPSSNQDFFSSQTLAMACVSIIITTMQGSKCV